MEVVQSADIHEPVYVKSRHSVAEAKGLAP